MIKVARTFAAAGLLAALAASPALAQVIDPTLVGHNLSNNGWTADLNNSPFWDTWSADSPTSTTNCNIGFFALGTIDPTCKNAIPGTFASEAGILANPYGYTTNGPSQFGFAPGGYFVNLLGGYHGSNSTLFTYACDALGSSPGQCVLLTDLTAAGFTNSGVGTSVYLDYSGLGAGWYWGFGYSNTFNPSAGCDPGTFCSGYNSGTALPTPTGSPQFFALFESNNTCTWGHYCYLVGMEDNALNYLPNGNFRDGDYQDWVVGVTATPEPATMALLATGLIGLGGAGLVRRRRGPAAK